MSRPPDRRGWMLVAAIGEGADRGGRSRANSPCAPGRRNRPVLRQQRLKALSGAARAGVAPAEFFDQLLFSAPHEAQTALPPCFGREALPTLVGDLERKGGRHGRCVALSASSYRARNCSGRVPYSRRTGNESTFRSRRAFPAPPRRGR